MATRDARVRAPATLRDVARVAGVHPATASRALNAEMRSLVNRDTARRVRDAAESLGYLPNPIARGLKTNRSYTVGVLVPDLTNPLFPPILRGIETAWGARATPRSSRTPTTTPSARWPTGGRCGPGRWTG